MEDFNILEEKANPLLKRRELKISIVSNIAPKIQEAATIIADKLSIPLEAVKIRKIQGRFGSNNFIILSNVYLSKEDKDKIEPKQKAKKVKPEGKK